MPRFLTVLDVDSTLIEDEVIEILAEAAGSRVVDSIVFERAHIGPGAVVERAILDKDVVIAEGASVGVDPEADRARGFTVTPSGITVVGKGVRVDQ